MGQLGDTLRQARLDKGTTLDEAAEATHVRRSYLESLEADDPVGLPAPVYTRGFIRTYAEYLGLNPQVLVDMYQPIQRQQPATSLRPALPHMPLPRHIPFRLLAAILSVALAIVLAVWLWGIYQSLRAATGNTDTPVVRLTPTVEVRQPTLPPIIALASPSAVPTATPEPSPSPSPTVEVAGILVQLHATGSVYVEAAVDGQASIAETLSAGADRTLPLAQSSVQLRVSNPSLLQITVNGQPQQQASGTSPVEYSWQR